MVAELKDEVELPLTSENLDQVHQVRVLQVLQHSDDNDDDDQLQPKGVVLNVQIEIQETICGDGRR